MAAIVIFAVIFAIGAFLLLARYSSGSATVRTAEIEERRRRPDPRPRMEPEALLGLVRDLLRAMGIETTEEVPVGDGRFRLNAVRRDPLRETPFVVFLEASPRGDVVEQTTVVELADTVRSEGGAVGLLVTPFSIAREGLGGLGAAIELVDGPRLRGLIEEHLPVSARMIEAYRGFGRRLEIDEVSHERRWSYT
jgi:hypothetical protein